MKTASRKIMTLAAGCAVLAVGLLWNGEATLTGGLVTSAAARVGRPLTPMSYAGVARRTTRRAVAVGAGAAAAGAYYAPGCVQVVDAYGQVVTRC